MTTRTANRDARPLVQKTEPFLGAKNYAAVMACLQLGRVVLYPTDDLPTYDYYSLQGRNFNNWYVVLSYGYWPLWAYHRPSACWFGNADNYSTSTSKHANQTRPRGTPTMLPCDELKALIMGLPMLP